MHVTRDGGDTWARIDERARGVTRGAWVPMIAPSPHESGTAFVVFDDHRRGDMRPYVYRVDDFGRRWTALQTDELSGYALSVLQDPVDPALLFLGTEFGLYVSVDAGESWTKFTAGLPTVSVMDMAIQERENDLVLGTHGRSIYIIDDYSALRGLSGDDFVARLRVLSATTGQHYDANQTPSTRFTGSGEFRAQNEPYGVMVTFMASGDDLRHPDEHTERERKIRRRENRNEAEDDEEDNGKDELPKVKVEVRDSGGELIRTFRSDVHQGINRVAWGMQRDGVRAMPGDEEQDYEDGLPPGPAVPPGNYEITLSLPVRDGDDVTANVTVDTVADPRSPYTQAELEQNYRARVELLDMRERAVAAVERIVRARDDVAAIKGLIAKRDDDESLKALGERAGEIREALGELEKMFRTPPETTGITYSADKVQNRIGLASGYVGSSFGAPTPTAQSYIAIARAALDEGIASLNEYLRAELEDFRNAVDEAGIGLLSGVGPLE